MDLYSVVAKQIINAQYTVIGPLALEQAKKVKGLKVTSAEDIVLTGNAKQILEELVNQYQDIFGKASVEVCKDAVKEVKPPVSPDELPEILK